VGAVKLGQAYLEYAGIVNLNWAGLTTVRLVALCFASMQLLRNTRFRDCFVELKRVGSTY